MLLRNQRTLLLCFNLALLSRQDLIPGGCHTLKAKMIGNVFKGASHLILQTSLVTSLHSSLSTGLHICFCTFSHLTNHMILRFPISNCCALLSLALTCPQWWSGILSGTFPQQSYYKQPEFHRNTPPLPRRGKPSKSFWIIHQKKIFEFFFQISCQIRSEKANRETVTLKICPTC